MTGSWDWLVGWLLNFRPDDPVDRWERNKWLFAIVEKISQLALHGQPERPYQAGAEKEGGYDPRLGVRGSKELWTSTNSSPTSLGVLG